MIINPRSNSLTL